MNQDLIPARRPQRRIATLVVVLCALMLCLGTAGVVAAKPGGVPGGGGPGGDSGSGGSGGGGGGSGGPFSLTIVSTALVGNVITISGNADSPAGENSGNYVVIDWGDGQNDQLPNFTGDGPWVWGSLLHTYAAGGSYTIIATLMHASPSGNDRSGATDSADVDVPTDGGDDDTGDDTGDDDTTGDDDVSDDDDTGDDDSTGDDDTTGGDDDTGDDDTTGDDDDVTDDTGNDDTTGNDTGDDDGQDPSDTVQETDTSDDGGATVDDRVLGRVVRRDRPARLAKTGPETTVIAVLGVLFLFAGASIRRLTPLRIAFAGQGAVAREIECFGLTLMIPSHRSRHRHRE